MSSSWSIPRCVGHHCRRRGFGFRWRADDHILASRPLNPESVFVTQEQRAAPSPHDEKVVLTPLKIGPFLRQAHPVQRQDIAVGRAEMFEACVWRCGGTSV